MLHTRDTWPIAAALHQFADPSVHRADPEVWLSHLREVAAVGFQNIDLTDSWIQVGDLVPSRVLELQSVLRVLGLTMPVVSITRRSVIDPRLGDSNLAYTHRSVDVGAELGVQVLSLGLHRPLTAAQRDQLWFWTVPGDVDSLSDPEARDLAVSRFREIGLHAADVGMLVSLELYEDTLLGTSQSAVELVDAIGLPNVGLNPDIGNLVRLHRPIEDWREILAKTLPYTNYWQVKNYFRDEDPMTGTVVAIPAPLALGFINYRDAVREALAGGFQGIFCCEHYGGDGLGVSAMNMAYLRTLLPEVGTETPPARVGSATGASLGVRRNP